MSKEKEVKEEVKEEVEVKEEAKLPIELGQVPDSFRKVISTPEGLMEMDYYLVWLGNLVWELKKHVIG
jgi:hypothetical protein